MDGESYAPQGQLCPAGRTAMKMSTKLATEGIDDTVENFNILRGLSEI